MIGNDWDIILKNVWESEGFKNFMNEVKKEYNKNICYPEFDNIFNALKQTPYNKVKAVIIGQDPYFNVGEAHGLSFSVQRGVALPPSLRNIFKELKNDLGIEMSTYGDLTKWSKEGVLLLNSILSVKKGQALSHKNLGWQNLTDYILKILNNKKEPLVFILWGNFARSKKVYITNKRHLVIESTHPSPFAAHNGFFGSKPFSRTNEFLKLNGIKEINFEL